MAKLVRWHKDRWHLASVCPLAMPTSVARNVPWARCVDHERKSGGVAVIDPRWQEVTWPHQWPGTHCI
eukprot:10952982-Lingulodinium_polyedra.AAC.1